MYRVVSSSFSSLQCFAAVRNIFGLEAHVRCKRLYIHL